MKRFYAAVVGFIVLVLLISYRFSPETRHREAIARYQNYLVKHTGKEYTTAAGEVLPFPAKETVRYVGMEEGFLDEWHFIFRVEQNGVVVSHKILVEEKLESRPYGDVSLQKECDIPILLHVSKINAFEVTYKFETLKDYREVAAALPK
jgi:hypothetical protein